MSASRRIGCRSSQLLCRTRNGRAQAGGWFRNGSVLSRGGSSHRPGMPPVRLFNLIWATRLVSFLSLRLAPTWLFENPSSKNARSEEHTSELQSQSNLVCRLLLEKKKNKKMRHIME